MIATYPPLARLSWLRAHRAELTEGRVVGEFAELRGFARDVRALAEESRDEWATMSGHEKEGLRRVHAEFIELRADIAGVSVRKPRELMVKACRFARRPRMITMTVGAFSGFIAAIDPLLEADRRKDEAVSAAIFAAHPDLPERLARGRAQAAAGLVTEWVPSEEVRRSVFGS